MEINPTKEGISRRCGGVLARDADGETHLLHRGNVGGGRQGIGKDAFVSWYEDAEWRSVRWSDGSEDSLIWIGRIEEEGFRSRLGAFVRAVAEFKRAVA